MGVYKGPGEVAKGVRVGGAACVCMYGSLRGEKGRVAMTSSVGMASSCSLWS